MDAPQPFDALLTDVDGTIVRPGQKVDPQLESALLRLQSRVFVGLVTGRPASGLASIFNASSIFFPTIALNGASLHLDAWTHATRISTVDRIVPSTVMDIAAHDALIAVYFGDRWEFAGRIEFVPELERLTSVASSGGFSGRGNCAKVVVRCEPNDAARIRAQIEAKLRDIVTISTSLAGFIEITAPGADKSTFLPELLPRPSMRVIGVGDGENDVPIVESCQTFWTFSTAHTRLRTATTNILPYENGKGVLWLVESLLRGRAP